MNIFDAFVYIFNDPKWPGKVAVAAVITFMSVLLAPLLIGAVGWAALFGYQIEIIRRMRGGARYPLPRWEYFNRYLLEGVSVFIAFVIYMLPNGVFALMAGLLSGSIGSLDTILTGGLILAASCCLLPLVLVYNVISAPAFALGMGRYTQETRFGTFFEVETLWAALRPNFDLALQWLLGNLGALILFSLLLALPCIGWMVFSALLAPIYGGLAGSFAVAALGKKDRPAAQLR